MSQNSVNLIHKIVDESAARIGKKKRDEKLSSTEVLTHPSLVLSKDNKYMSDDEFSLCCIDYISLTSKKLCCNTDNGKATESNL